MAAETRTASERALSLLDAAFFMLESEERMSNVGPLLILRPPADSGGAQAYARRLLAAGVEATATRHIGTIHDFMVLNPLAGSAATRGAVAQASAALRHALFGR